MDFFWAIQLLGFAGFAIDIGAYQLRNGRHIMILAVPSLLLWAVHYALLGGMTGAIMCLATALRTTLCLICPPQHRKTIFAAGILVILAITAMSWAGPISLLPCLGALSYCVTVLKPDNATVIRAASAATAFFWLLYGFMTGSWAEITASTVALISLGIAFWRYRPMKQKQATISANATVTSQAIA